MNRLTFVLFILLTPSPAAAQDVKESMPRYAVEVNRFPANWFLQAGLDMSLQNPYGYEFFGDVFPCGRTFGVDMAAGKWFSPALGLRAKINWENGIRLFENTKATWLAPFDKPGTNMDRGGYMTAAGDVLLDIHNLFCGYKDTRHWNLQAFARAGVLYNFGVSKGSPLIGFGLSSTYRINSSWSVYADMAYNMVSSGHVGIESGAFTGTGSGSNGFADLNVGVQYDLGQSGFKRADSSNDNTERVLTNSFRDNWFVRAGLDMSLQLPYGKPPSAMFSKGRSFGFDAAVGRWFTPEAGLRVRLNWENGFPLFQNNKLEWLASDDENETNMDKGGYLLLSMDVPLSVANMLMGYDEHRKWDGIFYARAGVISNLAISSASPLIGCGIGSTYRLTPRLHLYADLGMQGTTSEFYGNVACTGMSVPVGFNCFFDLEAGVQIALGRNARHTFKPKSCYR